MDVCIMQNTTVSITRSGIFSFQFLTIFTTWFSMYTGFTGILFCMLRYRLCSYLVDIKVDVLHNGELGL